MVTLLPAGLRLAVNTQTPLIRFREGSLRADAATRLSDLVEGEDYKLTTGGVTRMLLPLLRRWQQDGALDAAAWVAMGADAEDRQLEHDGLRLRFVGLPPEARSGYAVVKERMWELLNTNPGAHAYGEDGIPEAAWAAFDAYQSRSAQALQDVGERIGGLDALYVHDFQQVGVAQAWKGRAIPKVFHLHTPFPSVLPAGWADYFVARLARYDAVIVSTRRYADNLRAAGLRTPVHVIHPFIDPSTYTAATPGDALAFRDRYGIPRDDRIILNVGRMDPMKGQDRLLRALPRILAREPRARVVLVGNGSFSSSKQGGLGLDKGKSWRTELEALARALGIEDRVTFTGHLGDDLLPAAYRASEAFCLPSTREGFGLAAIEAWRYERPVVVCERAGVSELVEDGVNGYSVDCAEPEALARALLRALSDEGPAMGRAGFAASRVATLDVGQRTLEGVLAAAMEAPHAVA